MARQREEYVHDALHRTRPFSDYVCINIELQRRKRRRSCRHEYRAEANRRLSYLALQDILVLALAHESPRHREDEWASEDGPSIRVVVCHMNPRYRFTCFYKDGKINVSPTNNTPDLQQLFS